MSTTGQAPPPIALRDNREQLRTVFDALADGVLVCDAGGVIVEASAAASGMFGVARDRLIGGGLERLSPGVPPYGRTEALAHLTTARGRGEARFDWRCRAGGGRLFWCEIVMRPADLAGRTVVLATLRDITTRKEREDGLAQSVRRDPVTGLPNHLDLTEKLQQEVARYERYGGYLCLALGDVDPLAGAADRLGQPGGEAILVTIAEFLRGRLRKSDYLARWSGDAFAMLLHDTRPDTATRTLHRTRAALESHAVTVLGRPLAMRFGVTSYQLSDSVGDLIERAERALALARQNGGNRLVTA